MGGPDRTNPYPSPGLSVVVESWVATSTETEMIHILFLLGLTMVVDREAMIPPVQTLPVRNRSQSGPV